MREREAKEGRYATTINKRSQNIQRGVAPLVADAERRRQAQRELELMQQQKAQIESSRAFINSKSDKVMYDRFDSDFNRAVDHLQLSLASQTRRAFPAQHSQGPHEHDLLSQAIQTILIQDHKTKPSTLPHPQVRDEPLPEQLPQLPHARSHRVSVDNLPRETRQLRQP